MRQIAVASVGILLLMAVAPATAQTPPPGDTGSRLGDQVTRSAPSPTAPPQADPPKMRQAEPPARTDDEFDPPPAGCRYRENKLDLLV